SATWSTTRRGVAALAIAEHVAADLLSEGGVGTAGFAGDREVNESSREAAEEVLVRPDEAMGRLHDPHDAWAEPATDPRREVVADRGCIFARESEVNLVKTASERLHPSIPIDTRVRYLHADGTPAVRRELQREKPILRATTARDQDFDADEHLVHQISLAGC